MLNCKCKVAFITARLFIAAALCAVAIPVSAAATEPDKESSANTDPAVSDALNFIGRLYVAQGDNKSEAVNLKVSPQTASVAAGEKQDTRVYLVGDLVIGLSEYWIGIDGTPAEDVLRAQLELPAGQGVVINQIVDDSPAAKAGLKQYDVLLAADDKPLVELSDLAGLIQEKKDHSVSVKLVRGGKRITIEVTPARRPASQTGETCPQISKLPDADFARRVWLDLIGTAATDEEAQRFIDDKKADKRAQLANWLLRKSTVAAKSCTACHSDSTASANLVANMVDRVLYFDDLARVPFVEFGSELDLGLERAWVRTAVSVPGGAPPQELPDDVTITITRHGKQPALIVVAKGKETWHATAGELDKLPQEARGAVEHLLGVAPKPAVTGVELPIELHHAPRNQWTIGRVHIGVPPAEVFLGRTLRLHTSPAPQEPEKPSAALQRLDKELGALRDRLEELRKSLEGVQNQLSDKEPPAAKEPREEKK